MTAQEAYEKIREYFSRPGAERGVSNNGTCAYRSTNGSYCAVGALIPDDLYDPSMDEAGGLPFLELLEKLQDTTSNVRLSLGDERAERLYELLDDDPQKREFLNDAQREHDLSIDVKSFLSKLDYLAVVHHCLKTA